MICQKSPVTIDRHPSRSTATLRNRRPLVARASLLALLSILAGAACSSEDATPPGTGGGGGASGSAGSAGTGGASGTGGGSGGTSGSGGASGTGGTAGTGGAAGTDGAGGATGGTAGTGGSAGTGANTPEAGASDAAEASVPRDSTAVPTDGGARDASIEREPSGEGGGNCAGMALALNSNIAGGADPAKSRVEATLGSDLPIGNTTRTVEFWAFTHANSWVGENNTIFEYGSQLAPNGGFGLDFGTVPGTLDPYTNGSFDNEGAPGLTNFNMDQWVHFAMTYNGTAVTMYVNGVTTARGTKTSPGNMLQTTVTALTIGGNPRGAFFNGYIDEFRVWNVARSAAEIAATMRTALTGTEAGLVGYWKFDEPAGTTTAADSANGAGHTKHNGTLMATSPAMVPTFISSTAPIACP